MADNTKLQYIIELLTQGDTKKAQQEMEALNKTSKGATEGVAALTGGFGKLFAVLGGVALIHQSIDAFIEQEKAIAKLNAALKSTDQYTEALSKQMQDLAEQMAETSLFADEAILNVIAKLTALGAKKEDVQRLTQATLDLATLMDGDLNQAARQMALAVGGAGAEAFDRLRLNIDKTLTPTQQFNQALQEIEKRAGGQAREAIKTLGGDYQMFLKDVNELKEALGGLFLKLAYVPAKNVFNDIRELFGGKAQPGPSMADFAGRPTLPLSASSNAALMKAAGITAPGTPAVTSLGLSKADEDEALAFLEDVRAAYAANILAEQQGEEALNKIQDQNLEDFKHGAEIKRQLTDELILVGLDGAEKEAAQIKIHHEDRLQQISAERFATSEQYDEALAAEAQLYEAEKKRATFSQQVAVRLNTDMRDLAANGIQLFAGGLAGAIVGAFEEGGKAFQKFAANFLKQIAEMILQTLILKAIQSAIGGLSGGGQAGSAFYGDYNLAAAGGRFKPIFAAGGVNDVSSATYFPKFNVIAGEAGREVMTVLAKPRMANFNGLSAQVGMAGSNRLAITSADALAAHAGGGAGGAVQIMISLTPGLKGEIVQASLQNVTVQMQQDTTLSRATKNLTK
jgi:hypothetical protein